MVAFEILGDAVSALEGFKAGLVGVMNPFVAS